MSIRHNHSFTQDADHDNTAISSDRVIYVNDNMQHIILLKQDEYENEDHMCVCWTMALLSLTFVCFVILSQI
jgi:hypothetical protein